ncbi:MAG TPA: hypothetical protein VMV59_02010 [Candidatus Dormibacteraeota bacterium]|nr:hypothetical protein [Candidatus Dormibacteraeota bacterium]
MRWEVIQLAAAGRFIGVVYAEDQEKAFAAAVVELRIDPAGRYIVRKA